MKFSRTQAGFNLVELLVSVAISMAVLTGLTSMFGSQKNASRTQDSAAQIQETARVALNAIADSVKQAGFQRLEPTLQSVQQYGRAGFNEENGPGFEAVQLVNGVTDQLVTRFQVAGAFNAANGLGGNCAGVAPAVVAGAAIPGAQVANIYRVNANQQLECTTPAGNTVILANGVLDLQLRAGLSATAEFHDDSVASYIDASVLSAADVLRIRAIEVCLVLVSENRAGTAGATTDRYAGCAGPVNLAQRDGRIRQMFRQTMTVRNSVLGTM